MIDTYLNYIQEGEFPDVKKARISGKYMWLYHGTRMPIELVKKRGLTIKYNASTDARMRIPSIWFTSSAKYANLYTKEKIWGKSMGVVLLAKLDTKKVEFVERPIFIDEYVYHGDIPFKDILFPGTLKYKNIERQNKYLRARVK
jgi:hypothetical protein